MNFTIPIKLVVDGERVRQENADVVEMGTAGDDDTQRQDPIRLPGVRNRNARAQSRVPLVEQTAKSRRGDGSSTRRHVGAA